MKTDWFQKTSCHKYNFILRWTEVFYKLYTNISIKTFLKALKHTFIKSKPVNILFNSVSFFLSDLNDLI